MVSTGIFIWNRYNSSGGIAMKELHKELTKNVSVHIMQSDQFKNTGMEVEFMLEQQYVSDENFILSFLLDDVCKKYKTKKEVSNLFDSLYGMDLEVNEKSKGTCEIMEFYLQGINGSYVFEKDLWKKQLSILHEFVMCPNIEDGRFEEEQYKQAVKKACMAVSMVMDDPSTYALNKALSLYGKELNNRVLPSEERLKNIKNEDVVKAYQTMIQKSVVDIFVFSENDVNMVYEEVKNLFDFAPRDAKANMYHTCKKEGFVKEVEHKDISSSSVVVLYETNIHYKDALMPSMMVCNGMLGALPTSRLFQTIREEEGLCYFIESEHFVEDGILKIYFECDAFEIESILQKIDICIEEFKQGKIDPALLSMSQQLYANSWKSSVDYIKSRMNDCYRNKLLGRDDSIQTKVEQFYKVTLKDIQAVASGLEKKCVFMLVNGGNEDEKDCQ